MSLVDFNDFPMLHREIDGQRLIYLDSAATSLKPLATMEAESNYGRYYTANIHRGHSILSDEASFHFENARNIIAKFINADPNTVIMTQNTSYALAQIAIGLKFQSNDIILCAPNNHHSNLLPWLQQTKVVYLEGNPLLPINPKEVLISIKKHRPKLLSLSWVSNVNGVVQQVTEICKLAREHDVITVIDAAQGVPHLPVNVEELNCDFLTFS